METEKTEQVSESPPTAANLKTRLSKLGLDDLDIDSCHTNIRSKAKLVELVEQYEDIFSRHSLD